MNAWTWLPDVLNRLGWVLLHFLWQGAVIGALAGNTGNIRAGSSDPKK